MTAVPPSGPANAPIRWDISILIGPCIQVEAEEAADHILQSLRGSNLGACVGMSRWSEDEPVAVPPSVQELRETVRRLVEIAGER